MKGRYTMKRLLLIAVLVTAVFALPAAAANPHTQTLSISPAAPGQNAALVISGCGWQANGSVTVELISPVGASFAAVSTDSSGCFATSGTFETAGAGTYYVQAWEGHGNKPDAKLAFTVS